MAQTVILERRGFNTYFISEYGAFGFNYAFGSQFPAFSLSLGDECVVVWDDIEHHVTVCDASAVLAGTLFVGNGAPFGLPGNNEPFVIAWDSTGVIFFALTDTETHEHFVEIYQVEAEPDEPEEPVGIVIRNYSGTPVTYPGVEKVMFTTSDGGTQIFSKGEAVENVPIAVDFSDGDQVITAPDGTLVKSAIIQKPDTLTPDNIKLGVSIAGVVGEFKTESEEVTIPLAMADGDMVIVPTEGKLLASVTVQKPETLIPENIAEGVEIAGVVGTHSGGGGGGGDFDASDEMLKYFTYQLDSKTKSIILYRILYDAIYEDTGSYDVTIPDKLGGYNVVISSM